MKRNKVRQGLYEVSEVSGDTRHILGMVQKRVDGRWQASFINTCVDTDLYHIVRKRFIVLDEQEWFDYFPPPVLAMAETNDTVTLTDATEWLQDLAKNHGGPWTITQYSLVAANCEHIQVAIQLGISPAGLTRLTGSAENLPVEMQQQLSEGAEMSFESFVKELKSSLALSAAQPLMNFGGKIYDA